MQLVNSRNKYSKYNSGPLETPAICNIQRRLIDFIVYFLEMKHNQVWERCSRVPFEINSGLWWWSVENFPKETRREGKKHLRDEDSFNGENRKEARTPRLMLLLSHNSFNITQFFLHLLSLFSHSREYSTFQPRTLILFLIYLTPAVARAFLWKGLVQIAWSLTQIPSTWSQHCFGKSVGRNAWAQSSSACS